MPMHPELMAAAIADDTDAIRALIAQGARGGADSLGQTPLMLAAARGNTGAARLLAQACDLEAQSQHRGLTALGEALARNKRACARMLIKEAGASVDTQSKDTGKTALMRAIEEKKEKTAAFLIPLSNLDLRDENGRTALHWAAEKMADAIAGIFMEVTKKALKKGSGENLLVTFANQFGACDKKGHTPLMTAVIHKNERSVAELLNVHSEHEVMDNQGWTAFEHAMAGDFRYGVERLAPMASEQQLESALARREKNRPAKGRGEATVAQIARDQISQRQAQKARAVAVAQAANGAAKKHTELLAQTPEELKALGAKLAAAARDGRPMEILELLGQGAPLLTDSLGHTPLILAAKNGHAECVSILAPISDANARTMISGWSALGEAIRAGKDDCAKILLPLTDLAARQADDGMTLLMLAAKSGRPEWAKKLLPGSDFCAVDAKGNTALMHAADALAVDCAFMLAPLGDANAIDKTQKRTALMMAIGKSSVDAAKAAQCVKALLPFSNLEIRDGLDETALMQAARHGTVEIVRALLPACDARAATRDGVTALMIATQNPAPDSLDKVLALIGASDLKAATRREKTAFHIAVENESWEKADALNECVSLPVALNATKKGQKSGKMPRLAARVEALAIKKEIAAVSGVDKNDTPKAKSTTARADIDKKGGLGRRL